MSNRICQSACRKAIPKARLLCRNLLVFPRGNNSARNAGSISIYLNVPDSDTPPGWQRRTRFKLTIENKRPGKAVVRGRRLSILR